MHIFCPNCGKHIDVSIQEIEKLEGHYVCPQCLIEIDLEGFEQNAADFDYFDDEAQQDGYVKDPVQQEPSQPVASDNSASTATTLAQPPAYKPAASKQTTVHIWTCDNALHSPLHTLTPHLSPLTPLRATIIMTTLIE